MIRIYEYNNPYQYRDFESHLFSGLKPVFDFAADKVTITGTDYRISTINYNALFNRLINNMPEYNISFSDKQQSYAVVSHNANFALNIQANPLGCVLYVKIKKTVAEDITIILPENSRIDGVASNSITLSGEIDKVFIISAIIEGGELDWKDQTSSGGGVPQELIDSINSLFDDNNYIWENIITTNGDGTACTIIEEGDANDVYYMTLVYLKNSVNTPMDENYENNLDGYLFNLSNNDNVNETLRFQLFYDKSGNIYYRQEQIPGIFPDSWSILNLMNRDNAANLYVGMLHNKNIADSSYNIIVGDKETARQLRNGSYNTIIGLYAAQNLDDGSNVVIGFNAFSNATNATNCIIIGNSAANNVNAGIFNNMIAIGGNANGINTATIGNDYIIDTYLKGIVRTNRSFRPQSYTNAQIAAISNWQVGEIIKNSDKGTIQEYTSTGWVNVNPVITVSATEPTAPVDGDIWILP